MKTRRILALLMFCVLLIGSIPGCGKQDTPAGLTIWIVESTKNINYLARTAALYQETYPDAPIQIETFDLSYDEFSKQITTALIAGTGPDIIEIGFWEEQADIYKLMKSGVFADMSGYYDADTELDKNDLNQGVMDAGVYDGKRYLFPTDFDLPFFLSSKSMLEKYSLTADDFSSMEKLLSVLTRQYDPEIPVIYSDDLLSNQYGYFNVSPLDYTNQSVSFEDKDFRLTSECFKAAHLAKKPAHSSEAGSAHEDEAILIEGSISNARMFKTPRKQCFYLCQTKMEAPVQC